MPIKLANISKKYPNNSIIFDNASLTIEDNSFIALVGKSGSGKSTLLNLISGLDSPDSGDIQINDQSIVNINDNELSTIRNHNIGFIFQSFYLQPFLTVIENVETAAFPNINYKKIIQTNRANKLLSAVGLAEKANAYPKILSGGETQRVAIARALMNQPNIILADEPTGNLDAENSKNIIQLLRIIQNQTKCIMIIVTHDESISSSADRIIRISEGKLTDAF